MLGGGDVENFSDLSQQKKKKTTTKKQSKKIIPTANSGYLGSLSPKRGKSQKVIKSYNQEKLSIMDLCKCYMKLIEHNLPNALSWMTEEKQEFEN